MEKPGKLYIGTSGWTYKHWDGVFYPKELKKASQLQYYNSIFNTVELNNSFYRQPKPENYDSWGAAVDENFLFAVKANRFFTHMKKLKVNEVDLERFLAASARLGSHLGPVLFQLPPKWNLNIDRFSEFLNKLPKHYSYVFEFRNETWYHPDIFALLEQFNCAFCIYELDGHESPLAVTANFAYIRLHGPGGKYQGSYDTATLEKWAAYCKKILQLQKDVYVYFDNDQNGYAAFNAKQFAEMTRIP